MDSLELMEFRTFFKWHRSSTNISSVDEIGDPKKSSGHYRVSIRGADSYRPSSRFSLDQCASFRAAPYTEALGAPKSGVSP